MSLSSAAVALNPDFFTVLYCRFDTVTRLSAESSDIKFYGQKSELLILQFREKGEGKYQPSLSSTTYMKNNLCSLLLTSLIDLEMLHCL